MIKIGIESKALTDKLTDFQKRQLPFALARALTETALEAQRMVRNEMRIEFDRPTPYTLKGVRVISASKAKLFADVALQDGGGRNRPTQFLLPEIQGGPRNVKGYEKLLGNRYTVPGKELHLDAYGNIPGGWIARALSDSNLLRGGVTARTSKDAKVDMERMRARRAKRAASGKPVYFIGRPGGGRLPEGVWERRKIGSAWVVRPILIFVDRAPRYEERFEFRYTIDRVFRLRFNAHFAMSLQIALATAKG